MSAFGGKADIKLLRRNVRFDPKRSRLILQIAEECMLKSGDPMGGCDEHHVS